MSSVTSNLGLVLPDITDEVWQTVQDLSTNFAILDNVTELYSDSKPQSGFWNIRARIWNQNPESNHYAGWINLRSGEATPTWASIHSVSVGDFIVPTEDNGHFYRCIQSGYTAPNEPAWTVTSSSVVEDTKNKTIWSPSKYYNAYDIVVPTIDNDRFYVCTVAGNSGTTEPIWATSNGATTSDNMVVWTSYKIVKWQESGTSALFKVFGKIE